MFAGIRLSPETLQIIAEETEDYAAAAAALQARPVHSYMGRIVEKVTARIIAHNPFELDPEDLEPWEDAELIREERIGAPVRCQVEVTGCSSSTSSVIAYSERLTATGQWLVLDSYIPEKS